MAQSSYFGALVGPILALIILYVASTTGGHDIEWQNLDLWAPFVGPAIGDLDGDGHPELVICSQGSELIDSGRILVFDLVLWRCAQYPSRSWTVLLFMVWVI